MLKRGILQKFVLLSILVLGSLVSRAGHIAGGNITYECIGGDDYLVTLSIFRNCDETTLQPNQFIKFSNDCGDFFSISAPLIFTGEVSQLCPTALVNSACSGGPWPGMEIYKYQITVTLPPCDNWEIFWELCTRSVTNNVDDTLFPCYKINAMLNNAVAPCNSSPVVTQESIPYVCVNQPVNYNPGVTEADGDSLRFYLVSGLTAGGAPIVYEPGFSGIAPIPGITIGNNSGQLSFTPPATGTYTVVIEVEEYNTAGVLIGTMRHDIIFVVENCPQPVPQPDPGGFSNFTGDGTLVDNNVIQVCGGDAFCVEMEFTSPVPSTVLTLASQVETILPGATFTQTGTNPAVAEICWTVPPGFSSTYQINIEAQDDACPVFGVAYWGFIITPSIGVYGGPDVVICPGESVQLDATGDTDYLWQSFSGDPIDEGVNFSCTDCPNPVTTPSQTTTYLVTGLNNTTECIATDTVVVAIALEDLFVQSSSESCFLNDASIVLNVPYGSGDYDYLWETGDTSPNLLNIPAGDYDLTITDNVLGCSLDTTISIAFPPFPNTYAGPDDVSCGTTYTLQADSTAESGYWLVPDAADATFFPDIYTHDAEVIVVNNGTWTFYWVEDDGNNCTGIDSVQITFTTPPPIDVEESNGVCGLSYGLEADLPTIGTAFWTGPPGATFDPDPFDPEATVTVPDYGTSYITWNLDLGNECGGADSIEVQFDEPLIADAGTPTDSVCGDIYQLGALPDGINWSWSTNAPELTFAPSEFSTDATVTTTAWGTYEVYWTVSSDYCTDVDTLLLTFIEPPSANAGNDTIVCSDQIELSPVPSAGAGSWAGPVGSVFNPQPDTINPTVTAPAYGAYDFIWTEDNAFTCIDTDTVEVLFVEQPIADAGITDTICGLNYTLQAFPSVGTGTWSTQTAGIVIDDPSAAITGVVVPTQGTYFFVWTEDNGNGCTSQDSTAITFYEIPIPDAGLDDLVCGPEAVLDGTVTVGVPGWSGPAGSTFDPTPDAEDPSVVVTNYGVQEFVLTEDNNGCTATDTVAVEFIELPVSDAGPNDTICGLSYTLQAAASMGVGTWTTPPGATLSDPSDPNASVDVATAGVYDFIWTEDVGNGCTDQDTCSITFFAIPQPDAGPDDVVCGLEYLLSGDADGALPLWSNTSGATFDPAADAEITTAIATVYGPQSFVLTADNNGCTATDTVVVDFIELPVANAGPDETVCGLSHNLQATPSLGTGAWISPAGATIADPTDPNTAVDVTGAGTYTFIWTEDVGSGCTDQDTCLITFLSIPQPDAGPDDAVCGLEYALIGDADGGAPLWTNASGATFDPGADAESTTATAVTFGSQAFVLTADNGGCIGSDTVWVDFNESPVANAGLDTAVCGLTGGLQALSSVGTGTWSGPPGFFFSPAPSDPNAAVTGLGFGAATFTWTEENEGCVDTDDVTINFVEQPSADAGAGQVVCGLEADLEALPSVGSGLWYTNSSATIAPSIDQPAVSVTADSPGIVEFWWVENNGSGCVDSAAVQVEFLEVPIADPGPDDAICGLTYQLQAVPSSGAGVWNAPPTLTISDITDPQAEITAAAPGVFTLYWVESLGPCVDSAAVEIEFVDEPVANAGDDAIVCGLTYDLDASSNLTNGSWQAIAGLTFDDPTDPLTTVTADAYGTYTLTWEVFGGANCTDNDDVEITFVEAPVADAGLGGETCGLTFNLAAVPTGAVGAWTGPPGAVFSDNSDPAASVTMDDFGTFTFTWTESDPSGCTTSDDIDVVFLEQPIADAGPDQVACGFEFDLGALPSAGTGTWTTTGTGVVFAPGPDAPDATVTVSTQGSYTFTWTEVNGSCVDADEVVVDVTAQPVADAGADNTICGLSYTLGATGAGGTWQGPPGVVFNPSPDDPLATALVPAAGDYTFTWLIDNGNNCSDADEVTISFFDAPQVTDVTTTCIDGNINYVVSFTITGGDPSTYSVTGSGTLVGDTFTGDPLPNGATYSYEVQDANGCDVLVVSGSNVCPNLTFAGTMNSTPLQDCGDGPITAVHNGNNTLDGNDAFVFILQSNPSLPLGDVFAVNTTPEFTFQPGMVYGQTYYICAVVGNSDGIGGVDYADPLLSVAEGTPVVFYETPTALISGGGTACAGDTLWAEVSFTGTPPFTFTYTFNGQIQPPLSADDNQVSIPLTESGQLLPVALESEFCTGQSGGIVDVQFDPLPQAAISGQAQVCAGEVESFMVELTGTAPFTFVYALNSAPQPPVVTNQTNYDLTASQDGVYTLISVEDQSCVGEAEGSAELEVTPIPEPLTGPDLEVCYDDNGIAIGAPAVPGYSYQWNNGQFLSDPNAPDPVVTFTDQFFVPVELDFTLTVEDNGCVASDVVNVTLLPVPELQTNTSVSMCEGGAAQLQVTGADQIEWLPNAHISDNTVPMPFVYPPEDQEYEVSVSNDFGCSTTGSVLVVVNPMPEVVFTANVDSTCAPAVVSFQNQTNPEFMGTCLWNFGNGSLGYSCSSIINTYYEEQGEYDVSLTITSPEGCAFTATQFDYINTYGPDAFFDYSPHPADISNTRIQLENFSSDAQSYIWDFNEYGSSLDVNPVVEFPSEVPGEYEVCLTAIDDDGCFDEYCDVIEIAADILVYIPNAFSPNGDGLNDLFHPVMQGVDIVEYEFKIFNRRGKLVWSTTDPEDKWDGTDQTREYLDDNQTYVWTLRIKDQYSTLRADRSGFVMVVR